MRIRDWSSDVCSSDLCAGASPEEFGEAIASGKTTRFGFDQPFPVYVAYWTMVPDGKGGVKKLADLYGRDAPVVASFAKPGRPTATIIAPEPPPVVPQYGRGACRARVGKSV